jgi:hypothetical protein
MTCGHPQRQQRASFRRDRLGQSYSSSSQTERHYVCRDEGGLSVAARGQLIPRARLPTALRINDERHEVVVLRIDHRQGVYRPG